MKKIAVVSFLLSVLLFSNKSFAQNSGIGAGIIVGGPTGISAKFWTSNVNALDFAVGWSNTVQWTRFNDNLFYYYTQSSLHINADYVWHDFKVIRSTQRFPLYYGFGFHLESGNSLATAFGVRGVAGIDWMPYSVPLDVFVELAPVLYLAPATEMGLDMGVGARFFFH